MVGLEQYVTEHCKPICCNMWYEDTGDDALGIGNLRVSLNRIDDVLKSVGICTIFNSCATRYYTIQINQPTRCNNFASWLFDVYVQLNMFRASSRPSTGAQLQYQPLVLPLKRGGSSAVGLGLARPRPTAQLLPRSNGKTGGCYCSCWAPDDGREDARNMLNCT
jgi:hypothetical protein